MALDNAGYMVHKALVSLAIEKALFDLGEPVYDKVVKMLNKEYNCYLPDCYEHPEYLAEILEKLYGPSSVSIVESIQTTLNEFSYQKRIGKFLEIIAK